MQFGQLYDAFGVHGDEKNLEADSVLPFVDNAVQFYRKCVHDIMEFFELPLGKCFDRSLSFGAPSKKTIRDGRSGTERHHHRTICSAD